MNWEPELVVQAGKKIKENIGIGLQVLSLAGCVKIIAIN